MAKQATATAKKALAYDRAQNVYASGVSEQNAENIERLHADEITCECRVVPTNMFGEILTGAKVSFNGGAAAAVEDGGNIICVDRLSKLTYTVECDGYESVSGTVDFVKGNLLIKPILGYAPATAPSGDPEQGDVTPGGTTTDPEQGGESDNEL